MKIDNNIMSILEIKDGLSIQNWKGDLNLIEISRIYYKFNYFGRIIQKFEMIVRMLFNKKVSVIYLNKTR